MRALIASGSGRYADPWHPFPRTSPLLAEILRDTGFEVEIDDDVDQAMTRIDGVDLLVVNAADPWRDSAERLPADAAGPRRFSKALERGIGVLAMHCALASLRDYPDWAAALGGMWVPGQSWHPPLDTTRITGAALPDGTPVADFDVEDERYLSLQRIGHSHVVAHFDGAGGPEPAAWVREYRNSRIAVDALGHDERSYASEGHRALIRTLASWLTAGITPPG
ncbi:hypothetical protein GCM10028820_12070 [Tessaracoccus terricola]